MEKAACCLRLALPLMAKHGIPVTPRNYTVWYEYVSGENEELRRALDRLIAEGRPLSADDMASFHRQYCTDLKEKELIRLKEELLRLLSGVTKELAEMGGRTESYGETLSASLERLSGDSDLTEIRKVVDELIEQTAGMSEAEREVEEKLTRTSDELRALQRQVEQARAEATKDFLTGLLNRRAFHERAAELIEEAREGSTTFSLLMVDIDHFKAFNDRFGHLVGDEVLRFAAKKITDLIKGQDVAARFGGEEFTVLLPRTALEGAAAVAENIRAGFAEARLRKSSTGESLGTVTVSVGVAQHRPGEGLEQLVERADAALYRAKRNGRNRVERSTD